MTWNQKTAITLIVFALGVPLTKEAAAAPSKDSATNASEPLGEHPAAR